MPGKHVPPGTPSPGRDDRLDSWKEIASYLGRDVRTAHRWEVEEGLPVHRHVHSRQGTVYAYRSELDAWRASRSAPRAPSSPRGRAMLAVLPFANLSGDPQQDYFSDGLTEEVIAQLGHLAPEGLGVIARTSVMQYRQTATPVDRIGDELRVDYVLEGSVRRAAGRARITAQLIEVRDQTHLWAEIYDRDLDDVLLVQSDIARAIAREIDVTVTPEGTRRLAALRRVDAEAYDACLKGRFHWYKLSREHLDIAQHYFELALRKDPAYALAHAGLAYVWFSRGDCGLAPTGEAFPAARARALEALALDDSLTQVHELLGNIRRHFDWDWSGAEDAFRHAIALDPNYADGHFMYADLLISIGRPGKAARELTRALELDPLNVLFNCFRGWHSLYRRRDDEAIAQLTATLKADPQYPAAYLGLWGAHARSGRHADALDAAARFFRLLGDGEIAQALDGGSGDARYRAAMRRAAVILERRAGETHVPAVRIARLCVHGGEPDRALDWLEKACDAREAALVHLPVAWDWDDIRDRPRFQGLLRRMKFPASARARPGAGGDRNRPANGKRR